ncbi:hypothetical protein RQP46_004113 [Phenoliferia psychrophenolica]
MSRSLSRGASRILQTAQRPTTTTQAPAGCCSQVRLAHKLVEVELRQPVLGLGSPGDRIPVAPGRARSLFKELRALYVVKGRVISPMRDLLRRADSQAERQRIRDSKARGEVQPALAQDPVDEVDPRVAALASETDLRTALSLVPTPLVFHRRLIHSPSPPPTLLPGQQPSTPIETSSEIFGSVSVLDVINHLREFGVVVDEANAAFEEGTGVEKARLKATGVYSFVVQFKALGESTAVQVEVLREV